jgi:iron complex transport system ATP-binding protein
MKEVLALHDVSVIRDGKIILDGVNWQVSDDERWVIVGPKGAGGDTW